VSRVAVLSYPPSDAGQLRVAEDAARSLGLRLRARWA
jgi:hypothetical protein